MRIFKSSILTMVILFFSYTSILTQTFWEELFPMSVNRNGVSSVVFNGKIYTFGGALTIQNPTNITEEYNINSDVWTTKVPMPSPRKNMVSVVLNDKIYVIGGNTSSGNSPTNIVEVYDPLNDSWSVAAPINRERSMFGGVTYNGKIYIFNGHTWGDIIVTECEEYDPVSNSWSIVTTLPNPQIYFISSVAEVNGKVYLLGGRQIISGTSVSKDNVDIYDINNNTWSTGQQLPTPRWQLGVVSYEDKIYAFGGTNDMDPWTTISNVEIYNPLKDSWTVGESIPISTAHMGIVNDETKIYLIGGASSETIDPRLNNLQVYYPEGKLDLKNGVISGTISTVTNGEVLTNILVKLLDNAGLPVEGFDDVYTDENGAYSFNDVPIGDYQVGIVEPLGYITDINPKLAVVVSDETTLIDFALEEIVLVNSARSKGYWKHQFDVYIKGKGNAQESEQFLNDYIDLVHKHYTLYYDIFTDVNTFEEWQAILSLKGSRPMVDRAKQHLSALILNMVSNKIGQYTIVTDDGRTVGDVIQYVSELIIDEDDTNDEMAKDLAESVNNQQMIGSGLVPVGDLLFKSGTKSGEVLSYELSNNYPNPFNPSTVINYQLPKSSMVTLKVYNMLGEEVSILVNREQPAGSYEVNFDASNLSSGVYYYRIIAGNFIETKKMLLLK